MKTLFLLFLFSTFTLGQGVKIPPAIRKVTALPAACIAVGSDSSTNAVLYQGRVYTCSATNTWTFAPGATAALTASRALASDASGNIVAATTTATELGYVNGVTSAIQTQLDAKVGTALTTNRIPYGVGGAYSSSALLTFEPAGAFSRLTVTATGSNIPAYFDIVPTGNAGSFWRQTGGTGVMAFNNVNGTGVQFYSNGLLSLDVRHATTSVNYAKITGAATGAGVIYGADSGVDSNININLTPKGSGDVSVTTGNLLVATAGKSLQIKTGSNACSGSSTLSSGTVTVSTTCTGTTWGTDFIILLTPRGSSIGTLRVSTHTAATSFVITSTDAASSDPVGWMIIKQN